MLGCSLCRVPRSPLGRVPEELRSVVGAEGIQRAWQVTLAAVSPGAHLSSNSLEQIDFYYIYFVPGVLILEILQYLQYLMGREK